MTVLYTVKNYTYSGQATFAINFPLGILSRTHVTIQVNGAVDGDGEPQNYTNFDWVSDAEIIINGLETDDTIVIRRTVPKTQLLTAFGEGKDITRENMDDQSWCITKYSTDAYRTLTSLPRLHRCKPSLTLLVAHMTVTFL